MQMAWTSSPTLNFVAPAPELGGAVGAGAGEDGAVTGLEWVTSFGALGAAVRGGVAPGTGRTIGPRRNHSLGSGGYCRSSRNLARMEPVYTSVTVAVNHFPPYST